jgi:hypothetical protein
VFSRCLHIVWHRLGLICLFECNRQLRIDVLRFGFGWAHSYGMLCSCELSCLVVVAACVKHTCVCWLGKLPTVTVLLVNHGSACCQASRTCCLSQHAHAVFTRTCVTHAMCGATVRKSMRQTGSPLVQCRRQCGQGVAEDLADGTHHSQLATCASHIPVTPIQTPFFYYIPS